MNKELTPKQRAQYEALRTRVRETYNAYQSSGMSTARRKQQLIERWRKANAKLDEFVDKYM